MRLNAIPYKCKKAWKYLRHFGPKAFFEHLVERLEPSDVPYGPWFEKYRPDKETLDALRRKNRSDDPFVSLIVPAYEPNEAYFRAMVASVAAQTYENWELCIADASDRTDRVRRVLREFSALEWTEDGTKERVPGRIRVRHLSRNGGIADNTNAAFAMTSGTYIGLLDHDDLLAPHALRMMVDAAEGGADMLYSDEDKITAEGEKHFQPNLKPSFNEDLLRSNNYITHFLVVRRALFETVGGFRHDYDGAQDYDFIFRCAEQAKRIVRVPEILYHWRTHASSTADNPESKLYAYEAGKRAIEDHLTRVGEEGEVMLLPEYGFYRVRYPVKGTPLVSIIIPNKDEAEALRLCMDAIRRNAYAHYEVIIVENGSVDAETFALYEELQKDPKIRVIPYDAPFNYAAINNAAAAVANGDYLLFMNNDVRASIDRGWLSEMLGVCMRPHVGAVGAKLYYPDDHIQHAGCIIGIGGIAGAVFTDMPRSRKGYLNKASILQDLSAVTAALMMTKKESFDAVGGFTEELAVAFNDIDYCLKLREQDLLVVFDPYVEAYHDESRTRGPEDTEEKRRRFQNEIEYMRTRWEDILKEGDPYYHPHLSLKKWDYSLKP